MASSVFSRRFGCGISGLPGCLLLAGLFVVGHGKVSSVEAARPVATEESAGRLAEW